MLFGIDTFNAYKGNYGISIANSQPVDRNNPVYKPLQPGWELVNAHKNGQLTNDEYMALYFEKLHNLDAGQVYRDLCKLVNGNKPVLLSWEKKGTVCHRYMAASWLQHELTRINDED